MIARRDVEKRPPARRTSRDSENDRISRIDRLRSGNLPLLTNFDQKNLVDHVTSTEWRFQICVGHWKRQSLTILHNPPSLLPFPSRQLSTARKSLPFCFFRLTLEHGIKLPELMKIWKSFGKGQTRRLLKLLQYTVHFQWKEWTFENQFMVFKVCENQGIKFFPLPLENLIELSCSSFEMRS